MRGSGVALNLPFNRGDFFNRITSESQRFVRQFRRVGKSGGRKRILDRENDLFRNVDVRWSGACHREKVENRAFVRRDRCLGINSSNQTRNALFFRSCCYVFLFFFSFRWLVSELVEQTLFNERRRTPLNDNQSFRLRTC